MQIYPHKVKRTAIPGLFPCTEPRALSPRLLHSRGTQGPKGRDGVALVVVLFAVALISVIILAYFDLALLNRNISYSSAGQARANILALSALDYVKGDFIAEIQSGSTQLADPTGSSVPIYQPTTNSTMLPYRMTSSVSLTAGSFPPNLVKWSSGTYPLWPATTAYNSILGPCRASIDPTSGSSIPTTQASINGHFIANSPTSLWTKPDFGTNTTFPVAIVPQWVYMTRQGPLGNTTPVTSLSVLANSTSTNSNYVIGRYAYTVYDEGGLVDVTAAGFSPTTFSGDATDVGRKGNQGFADLTQLGLSQTNVDQLVYWRNTTNGPSVAGYVGYLGTNYPSLTNAPSVGFLQAAPGDQAFVSRQDLIQYWTTELGANTNLLQYVTTFSREKNAPSWGPEHNAYDSNWQAYWNGANTNTVNPTNTSGFISYAYASNENSTNVAATGQSVYNRFLPNVRVTNAFTRLSGETAVVGEPLVKNRFDLNKLSLILYTGVLRTDTASQKTIYNYFGLIPNYSSTGAFTSWTYNHTTLLPPTPAASGSLYTDAKQIMTLDQVANAVNASSVATGREPDFFELLQAGILQGGMGLCSGDPTQTSTYNKGGEFYRYANGISTVDASGCPSYRFDVDGAIVYSQEKYQVIQIGANLIDQYSSDNYPTEIILNGEHFYGVKNLPYINAIGDTALRAAPSSLPATSPDAVSYPTVAQGGTVASYSQYQAYVHRWMTFALWNPHQNAAHPPAVGPTVFRICAAAGNEYPFISGINLPYHSTQIAGSDYSGRVFEPPAPVTTSITTNGAGASIQGPAWIGFTNTPSYYTNSFAEPTIIDYTNSFTTTSIGGVNMNDPDGRVATGLGWQRAGIYMGWSFTPDNTNKVSQCAALWTAPQTPVAHSTTQPIISKVNPSYQFSANSPLGTPTASTIGLTIYLQYLDASGNWHTYQELRGLENYRSGAGDPYMEPNDPEWSKWTPALTGSYTTAGDLIGPLANNQETWVISSLDPRAGRLNESTLRKGTSNLYVLTNTFAAAGQINTAAPAGPHFVTGGGGNVLVGTNGVNNLYATSGTYGYNSDRDYVTRVGDAAGWSNSAGSASPLPYGSQEQRPLQLDRPFRSVAELGYVFRDDPWKTLNLISANSADAGLQDIFYIGANTNGPTAPPPDVIAGKMNINSAVMNSVSAGNQGSLPLQALLAQGLRYYSLTNPNVIDSGSTNMITPSDAGTLATNIVSYIQTNALVNIGDIPGLFPQNTTISIPYPGLKAPREAMVRTLADSADTRTWNLMIDVVAQSGKLTSTATSLGNFTVEGEKHYWLHVAIDRFTGEIVDQQLEPVWD